MDEEAVEPQAEPIEQMLDDAQAESAQEDSNEQEHESKKPMIPLSALQKVREKKKEVELELQWQKQRTAELEARLGQKPQQPQEEDNSRYESATREDLSRSQEEAIRKIEERLWIKQNPEKYEEINEYLPTFLKQRPHLAAAIDLAPNRLEEAYALMKALSPKQQEKLKKDSAPVKKEAPHAPSGVPKAAALNEAVDVMNMTDAEFAAWRATKRKRR